MSYEQSVNRFTNQINSVINLHKINNQEFFNDVNQLKTNQITFRIFRTKYIELFDGTTAKFKNKDSFLGSYRRNINPNYFTQSKSKKVQTFNQEFRTYTITIPKTKVSSYYKVKPKTLQTKITKHISTKDTYRHTIVFEGLAKDKLKHIKQAWQLQKIKQNNLFAYQDVHLVFNFDVYLIQKEWYTYIVESDIWLTFTSGISTKENLSKLFDVALQNWFNYVVDLEQSDLFVIINNIQTIVYRNAD